MSHNQNHQQGVNVIAKSWSLATWNVRGVNGNVDDLVRVMQERKLDVLCVSETKRKGKEVHLVEPVDDCDGKEGGYQALWSGVDSDAHGSQGVGLILSCRVKQHMRDYRLVSSRLLWVRLKVGISRVLIVSCYAPGEGENDRVKDAFWDELSDILRGYEANERVIVLGDLNGWVGVRRDGLDDVLGKFGDPRVNDNGTRVINLCIEHKLFVSNTWFKHKYT
ncbi:endonuclease/exonuclease/phosphatase family protein, partial [Klebsiella pneumoniae]|uniref:endonuclease/exonuclease/phosphatase family protein n=1 Tax=Klebsiella pneumoniae TaxID=573 RepID=UPI003531B6A8